MTNVYYLSLHKDTPKRGFWDYALVEDLLADYDKHEVDILPIEKFAIVVIPGRSHKDDIVKINNQLAHIDNVLLFVMGDEEAVFPLDKIRHNHIITWVQNPKPSLTGSYRLLGCGYTPSIHNEQEFVEKDLDWCFAGQMTHNRRYACVSYLTKCDNGYLMTADRFTGGIEPDQYYKKMARAKVAPCPGGPETVDTFRIFEALELGCVPIADNETPKADWTGFWPWLFGEPIPFPTINEYSDLKGYIEDTAKQYPILNNRVQSWWFRYKSKLKNQIVDDILELSGQYVGENITVVVPVSPIPSHPSCEIIEQTIKSIRHHLPKAEIIVTFDGIRPEQEAAKSSYEAHIRKFLWMSRTWGKVTPYIFEKHTHQAGMMRSIIDKIKTPLILYVEQDTPLVTDENIDFSFIESKIIDGTSNVVRLYHEGSIPKEHEQLMIGSDGDKLVRTYQWSQRPHVASVAFYRRMLSENFSDKSNCFIEDLIHGKLSEAYLVDGEIGWLQWRVHIYKPNAKNMKRSYHIDGRAGAKKYDELQVW